MMLMCTTRFDVESEQLALTEEYLSTQEIHAAREEKNVQNEKDEFDLISNGEDDLLGTRSQLLQRPSERALSKRPRKEATPPPPNQGPVTQLDNEDNEDDEDNIPLPNNSGLLEESSTQRRTSGRVSRRARRDKDLFVYQKP
jgi:hypothetical protein